MIVYQTWQIFLEHLHYNTYMEASQHQHGTYASSTASGRKQCATRGEQRSTYLNQTRHGWHQNKTMARNMVLNNHIITIFNLRSTILHTKHTFFACIQSHRYQTMSLNWISSFLSKYPQALLSSFLESSCFFTFVFLYSYTLHISFSSFPFFSPVHHL